VYVDLAAIETEDSPILIKMPPPCLYETKTIRFILEEH
jgi:hypothetical protein